MKQKQTPQTDKKVRLISTFNQNNPPIQKWIRQSRKYLDKNEKAKELGRNIQIAYKQPKNIKKLVGGPSGSGGRAPEEHQGCSKCVKKCHACKILMEGSTFKSTNTKKIYKIRQKVDCQSAYITLAHAKSAKVNMWVNPHNPSPGDILDISRRSKIKLEGWGSTMGVLGVVAMTI